MSIKWSLSLFKEFRNSRRNQHGVPGISLEAVNATIQWVKKTARGFRNVEHFKTAIYFHCGGLDLYPH
jgi:transposase